jgi:predicted nucleotidyltransferase|tara:strand:- start:291 stop:1391 length:1101 start_codon:yes stop_codon:yes gene_type:complete
MAHFYESILVDTVDGFQCKSYSNEHPEGYIIVKPKYVPKNVLEGKGLKYRFLFEKCLVRFNLFAKKENLKSYIKQFKEKFPDYIYDCKDTKNWYFVVSKSKIKTIHDSRKGLQELMQVPQKDLDEYLANVIELVEFLTKSGVKSQDLGITHSTLMGNYTPGKSDIDIIIYGKKNGWKILDFLKNTKHKKLNWKTDKEWAKYYEEHKTSESSHFTEEEYVKHMRRKRYEGMFDGNVFTLFTVEEPNETWFKWGEDNIEPLGTATVKGTVTDHYNSHVRPGFYEVSDSSMIDTHGKDIKIDKSLKIKRIVTFSIPFVQQALKGEEITACGLLELVTPKNGEKYYRVVIGYFDSYTSDRREKEFIKSSL